MPKVVKTASEILGHEMAPAAPAAEVTETGTPDAPAPDAKIAEPAVPEPEFPEPGFESPPSDPEPVAAPAPLPTPVVPTPPTPPPAPAPVPPAPVKPKSWRFVKNVHPGEIITFEGGETFKFPGSVLVTEDAKLAAKILAVSARHNIVQ